MFVYMSVLFLSPGLTYFLFAFQHEWISFYKQSERRTFSQAVINSCMFVHLTESGEVERLRLAFGGIGKQPMTFEEPVSKYTGRYSARSTPSDNCYASNLVVRLDVARIT